MSKITLSGHIIIPDADLDVVKEELPVHIDLTRKESGCLIFKVSQDTTDKNRFNVYEEYVDQPAFESHQHRVKTSKWGNISVNVERHYTINGLT